MDDYLDYLKTRMGKLQSQGSVQDYAKVALTDSAVQSTLRAAEAQLTAALEGQDLELNPRMQLALAALRALRAYAKSANPIPGYGGLGLRESLIFAERILELQPSSDRDIPIHSYKQIFLAFG